MKGGINVTDKEIIDLFFSRSESAIAETGAKYGKLCRKISYNILMNEEDMEECINSAYQKLWENIPPKNPESLCGYLCRIVRNLAINIRRKSAVHEDNCYEELSEVLLCDNNVERAYDSKQTGEYINAFMSEQKKQNRLVFTARYYFGMSVKEIASGYNMSENAVKSRLKRMRNELRIFLSERGVEV